MEASRAGAREPAVGIAGTQGEQSPRRLIKPTPVLPRRSEHLASRPAGNGARSTRGCAETPWSSAPAATSNPQSRPNLLARCASRPPRVVQLLALPLVPSAPVSLCLDARAFLVSWGHDGEVLLGQSNCHVGANGQAERRALSEAVSQRHAGAGARKASPAVSDILSRPSFAVHASTGKESVAPGKSAGEVQQNPLEIGHHR